MSEYHKILLAVECSLQHSVPFIRMISQDRNCLIIGVADTVDNIGKQFYYRWSEIPLNQKVELVRANENYVQTKQRMLELSYRAGSLDVMMTSSVTNSILMLSRGVFSLPKIRIAESTKKLEGVGNPKYLTAAQIRKMMTV